MQPTIIQPQDPTTPPTPPPSTDAMPAAPMQQAEFMTEPVTIPVASTPAPVEAEHKHRGLKFVASVVVLAVVFAGGYFTQSSLSTAAQDNATKKAQAFISDLNSGNTAAAYSLASAALHKQQSQSQFTTAIGDLKSTSPTLSDETLALNGRDAATYTATESGLPATASGSTSGNFTIALVKSGLTGWKVDSVSVE